MTCNYCSEWQGYFVCRQIIVNTHHPLIVGKSQSTDITNHMWANLYFRLQKVVESLHFGDFTGRLWTRLPDIMDWAKIGLKLMLYLACNNSTHHSMMTHIAESCWQKNPGELILRVLVSGRPESSSRHRLISPSLSEGVLSQWFFSSHNNTITTLPPCFLALKKHFGAPSAQIKGTLPSFKRSWPP